MNARETMLFMVKNTREEAEKAGKAYDAAWKKLEMQSRVHINLNSGTARTQLLQMASDSKKASDDLYATYQSLVTVLDEQCRPLLSGLTEEKDAYAVKEVAETIKWLNEESEIGNTFSASLNDSSLGDVAGVKYHPSMENKMIEKYWFGTLASMPGAKEAEAEYLENKRREQEEIKQKQEEAIRVREEAKRRQEEEARLEAVRREQTLQQDIIVLEKYYSEHKVWEDECTSIKRVREDLITERVKEIRIQLEEEANREIYPEIEKIKKDIASQEKRQSEAELKLSSLGLFKLSEKKEQRGIIEEAENQIRQLRDGLSNVERKLQQNLSDAAAEAKKNEPRFREEIEAEHPLPEEPMKSEAVYDAERRQEEEKERLEKEEAERRAAEKGISVEQDRLLSFLSTDKAMTAGEIADRMGVSNQRVQVLMGRLLEKDLVVRYVEKRKPYYQKAK